MANIKLIKDDKNVLFCVLLDIVWVVHTLKKIKKNLFDKETVLTFVLSFNLRLNDLHAKNKGKQRNRKFEKVDFLGHNLLNTHFSSRYIK